MNTIVSFQSSFEIRGKNGDPPGQELASFLFEGLRNSNIQICDLKNREDWGWDFRTEQNTFQIESIVGYVGDPPVQWLVTNHLHLSRWRSVFSGSSVRSQADSYLQFYCFAIHELLSDERFSSIRWYTQENYDNLTKDKWSLAP